MAHTLIEYARTRPGDVDMDVVSTFVEFADLLNFLPFQNAPNGLHSFAVETAIPVADFAGLNEPLTEVQCSEQRIV